MFDWIIRNGRVIDGTGNPPFRADVALQDGKIAFVGLLPADAPAAHTLDATGHCVTPGFIDVHSHADVTVFDNPQSHNKAGQGIPPISAATAVPPMPLGMAGPLPTRKSGRASRAA